MFNCLYRKLLVIEVLYDHLQPSQRLIHYRTYTLNDNETYILRSKFSYLYIYIYINLNPEVFNLLNV